MNRGLIALVSGITAVAVAAAVWGFGSSGSNASGGSAGTGGAGDRSGAADGSSSGSGPSARATGSGPSAAALAGLVGAGCADYALSVPSGPGSITGMTSQPIASALAGNPLLTTFYAALTGRLNRKVDLTAQLRAGSLTVFAPVDSAFALLPATRLARLRTDAPGLLALLRQHLVAGALGPAEVAGSHRTLAGTTLQVTGGAGAVSVDATPVICGGLRAQTSTVYLVGSLLPSS